MLATVFREYGLPKRIRSDNGAPFASRAIAGLSRLSIWWTKLGIEVERIPPGTPSANGRQERFHRTLKQHTAQPPAATRRAQQRAKRGSDPNSAAKFFWVVRILRRSMIVPLLSNRHTSLLFEPRSIPVTTATAGVLVSFDCLLFFCLVRPPFLLLSTRGQPSS